MDEKLTSKELKRMIIKTILSLHCTQIDGWQKNSLRMKEVVIKDKMKKKFKSCINRFLRKYPLDEERDK